MQQPQPLRVVVEIGRKNKKAFASAIDWPGWCRSGKSVEAAIDELLAYRERFNAVIALAGAEPIAGDTTVEVLEELAGDATTDFGAPAIAASIEYEPLDGAALDRQLAVVRAAWDFFDRAASEVSAELRKGPRGGGRDRDKVIEHTLEPERGYVRKLGVRTPPFKPLAREAVEAHRDAVLAALRERVPAGAADEKWPPRYVMRRMAWHTLDHAWEMQDRDLS